MLLFVRLWGLNLTTQPSKYIRTAELLGKGSTVKGKGVGLRQRWSRRGLCWAGGRSGLYRFLLQTLDSGGRDGAARHDNSTL